MIRPILLACALAAASAAASAAQAAEPALPKLDPAPAGLYASDPAHTSVIWSLEHSGLSHWTARFIDVDAKLDWKPADPTASTLRVAIDPAKLRTDFPHPEETDFDGMIATNEDFLAGAPLTFVSTSIERTGEKTGLVHGDLTMRGETHPVTLDVTFNGSMADHPFSHEAKVGFSAEARFNRSDWGMTVLLPFIGDEITLRIETQMIGQEG
ncbi:YceI family protein [Amaricoccus solimangrovi]|uniref:Polyisoprenoid-binding protein n=1 Tax=Amaricoccus solimangrovi TaxID=2589815 RepID=A0A501WYM5_9RHOB|nr:YceI family protein [Amaricoccus solimangrovi]TPE53892.1 polyisoprenoid-binding protein [Amaricoccus solimangrovi]